SADTARAESLLARAAERASQVRAPLRWADRPLLPAVAAAGRPDRRSGPVLPRAAQAGLPALEYRHAAPAVLPRAARSLQSVQPPPRESGRVQQRRRPLRASVSREDGCLHGGLQPCRNGWRRAEG